MATAESTPPDKATTTCCPVWPPHGSSLNEEGKNDNDDDDNLTVDHGRQTHSFWSHVEAGDFLVMHNDMVRTSSCDPQEKGFHVSGGRIVVFCKVRASSGVVLTFDGQARLVPYIVQYFCTIHTYNIWYGVGTSSIHTYAILYGMVPYINTYIPEYTLYSIEVWYRTSPRARGSMADWLLPREMKTNTPN